MDWLDIVMHAYAWFAIMSDAMMNLNAIALDSIGTGGKNDVHFAD